MENYLPSPGVPNAIRKGRNVYEGYQRGWGMECGTLKQNIAQDTDYREALKYSEGRSIVVAERLMNLFLLIKFYLQRVPFGNIIEYGSYRGGSAFFMAAAAAKFLPGAKVFALDTFTGMPQTNKEIDAHGAGDFADVDYAEILRAKENLKLDNLHIIKGLFSDTAPSALAEAKTIALAHIDCDIYDAVKYSYLISKPYMVPMGYYVFDDSVASSCIGATEAVEEIVVRQDGLVSEQIYPHHVFRAPPSEMQK